MIDSKHQSISQTMSASITEAINTITALCANSLRVGQLVLKTSSLYDSLQYSTNFIYIVDFFLLIYTLFRANNPALAVAKVELEAMSFLVLGLGVTVPSFARKAGIEPTLTVLETALLPLEDFRSSEAAINDFVTT